jgi:hypothetical protein
MACHEGNTGEGNGIAEEAFCSTGQEKASGDPEAQHKEVSTLIRRRK